MRLDGCCTSTLELRLEIYGTFAGLAQRIARQIAFGTVHRLTHGAYSTSNMALDGALADYGATTALPAWERYTCVKRFPPFGLELEPVLRGLREIAYYIGKYGGEELAQKAQLFEIPPVFLHQYQESIAAECLRTCGIPIEMKEDESVKRVLLLLRRYFARQQCHGIDIFIHTPSPVTGWLYDKLFESHHDNRDELIAELYSALGVVYASVYSSDPEQGWLTLRRYLMPREDLFRQELKRRIETEIVAAGLPDDMLRATIESTILKIVGANRRHWPLLPPGYVVLGQAVLEDCTLLYCKQQDSGATVLLVEGIRSNTAFRCLEVDLSLEAIAKQSFVGNASGALLILPAPAAPWKETIQVEIGGQTLRVPPLHHYYVPGAFSEANGAG